MTDTNPEKLSSQNIDVGDGPVGCYLIHGFTGSTYELQGLAEFLANHGLRVNARLLAGHGSSPAECNLVSATDWLEETEFHFTEFSLECEHTFAIGLSMGAGLALHLATLFPVAGVVAMSTALTLPSSFVPWYFPLVAPFYKSVPKQHIYRQPEEFDTRQFYGYDVWPLKGLKAMLKLNRYVRSELHQVTSPVLIMHSRADITAPFENAAQVFNAVRSKDKSLVSYDNSSHILPDDSEKEKVWSAILDFINTRISI
jgi:carboxylesterase